MGLGLAQQDPDLPDDEIDCDYRVRLMRDRLLSHMDRSSQAPPRGAAEQKFSTLLRKTRTACADQAPDLAAEIDSIEQIFEEHQARRRDEEAAREVLLAL